jgi:hypothetical protein
MPPQKTGNIVTRDHFIIVPIPVPVLSTLNVWHNIT